LRNISYAITESDALVTVDPMPWVEANQNHMLIVFQNLIINAIKYSTAPIHIHISAEVLGPRLIVKVGDNGIGIASKYQQFIFEPLKRLHGSEIRGAGIGLAVCKKIVEAAGGRIWVNSSLGAGSTFCFTVALAAAQRAASTVPRIDASAEFLRAQNIDGTGSEHPLLLRAGAAGR
jgi:signal transduction histidine kinase